MKRRTLLAGGATIASGVGIAGCYALASDDEDVADDTEDGGNDSGDSREDSDAEADAEEPIMSDDEPPGEVEEDTNVTQKDQAPHAEDQAPAEDRPEDATDTIEIASHDIQIEEYPQQDYSEVYVTGELQSGDFALANVQVDALGLDENEETIAHEFTQLAAVDPNATDPFEVPLYVEPDRLDSYQVAITHAEYAH